MSTFWTKPVLLIGRSGQIHVVATTEEAYACLVKDWPVSQGLAFFTALNICSKAIEGSERRNLARHALLRAATEAGVATQEVRAFDEIDDRRSASEADIVRRIEEDR